MGAFDDIPIDIKSNMPIFESPDEFFRNNGYYGFISLQATQGTELNLLVSINDCVMLAWVVIETQGQVQYLLKERPVITVSGTIVNPINYNRYNTNGYTFRSKFYTGNTISTSGYQTLMRDRLINYGTNPGQFSTGTTGAEISYFIFPPNYTYSLQLIPSVSMRMSIDLNFAEKIG